MRIPRFYQAEPFEIGQILELSAENFRHAIQVLRLKSSHSITLFNGEGGEYTANIIEVTRRSASVEIVSYNAVDRESTLTTQLVLAIIKPDKMDFAIQKAVELGISSIQPVTSERSVVHIKGSRLKKKIQHWEAVIIGACEQSGRTKIPRLVTPTSLQNYLQSPTTALRLAMLPTAKQTIKQLEFKNTPVDLLIGPEGGYTQMEEELIEKNTDACITLGSRILRAETATIAGLAVIYTQWDNL